MRRGREAPGANAAKRGVPLFHIDRASFELRDDEIEAFRNQTVNASVQEQELAAAAAEAKKAKEEEEYTSWKVGLPCDEIPKQGLHFSFFALLRHPAFWM